MNKIIYNLAEITKSLRGTIVYDFKLIDSITLTHFKKLMSLSNGYDSFKKTGYILEINVDAFVLLAEKINNSSEKKSRESHKKAIKKSRENEKFNCNHEDLGSMGYQHGTTVICPSCGDLTEVW